MQQPGNWHDVLTQLEEHLLQGSDALPLPQYIFDYFKALGLSISDDAAEALLEIQSIAYFLQETSLPDIETSIEAVKINAESIWAPGELLLIRDVLKTPGHWGLPELAGLLRRCHRHFPEGSLKAVVQALTDHPALFGAVADLFDTRAQSQLKKAEASAWLFPDGPPDIRKLPLQLGYRQVLHWIWQQPEAMLSWVKENPEVISFQWWIGFLSEMGHLLSPKGNALLDLLFPPSLIPQALPVIRTRIVMGDKVWKEKLSAVWMPMIELKKGHLHVILPESDTVFRDLVSFGELSLSPQEMFVLLGSCLNVHEIAEKRGFSLHVWLDLAFRSPDRPLFLKVIAEQLRIYPRIDGRLALMEACLVLPEGEASAIDLSFMEGLSHDKVSGLLEAALGGSRKITGWGGTLGRMLTSPSVYWSSALTEQVIEAMKLRPTLLHSALTSSGFKEAFCWRGKLSVLAKMIEGPRPVTDLFPETFHRQRDEWVIVIQRRMALYKAFPA